MIKKEKRLAMLENVRSEVKKILESDKSGHGLDHIDRVCRLALHFAQEENADPAKTALIALLHDVDDYKIVGMDASFKLANARYILKEANVDEELASQVLSELERIGYSKALKGMRPQSLEGKIVSDADMCDALGVHGVLRTFMYSQQTGFPFFDANTFPIENMNYAQYTNHSAASSVNHLFEKVLLLKDYMLTSSGKKEAQKRHEIVVEILKHYFDEEENPAWSAYLQEFLVRNDK
jgi:uncharacterized protein